MNRKTRSIGSLKAALAEAERSRQPAQKPCVSNQNQPEL